LGFVVRKAIEDNLGCLATCLLQGERQTLGEFKHKYTTILHDSVNYTLKERLDKIMNLIEVLIDEQCYEFEGYHNMLVKYSL